MKILCYEIWNHMVVVLCIIIQSRDLEVIMHANKFVGVLQQQAIALVLLMPLLSATVAGEASQTTPVQFTHVFVLRCSTQIVILIPVRVLLVTWCVLI